MLVDLPTRSNRQAPVLAFSTRSRRRQGRTPKNDLVGLRLPEVSFIARPIVYQEVMAKRVDRRCKQDDAALYDVDMKSEDPSSFIDVSMSSRKSTPNTVQTILPLPPKKARATDDHRANDVEQNVLAAIGSRSAWRGVHQSLRRRRRPR